MLTALVVLASTDTVLNAAIIYLIYRWERNHGTKKSVDAQP